MEPLILFTNKGLYCSAGNFYIDPWKPVANAVITHAHSDHAKPGHENIFATVLQNPCCRRGSALIIIKALSGTETVFINGVKISLHPAGPSSALHKYGLNTMMKYG